MPTDDRELMERALEFEGASTINRIALRHAKEENEKLRASLAKANAGFEEFEKKWYLAIDENEKLREELKQEQAKRHELAKAIEGK